MQIRSLHPLWLFTTLAILLVGAACGSGDDEGRNDNGAAGSSGGGVGTSGGGGDSQDSGGGGAMTMGAPTRNADPGQSWADVDGRRLTYEANGSINYSCSVTPDRIAINYQTAEGHDLLVNATLQNGAWVGSLTFKPGGDENVQYSGSIPTNVTMLGVGGNALSYEGSVDKIVDFDVANAETLDATIAVNCVSAGGDPTAVIDGMSYMFPTSGAQSVTCNIVEDRIEVRINRLAIDDLQLEIDATGPEWLGAAVVYAGDARFTSTLPVDGEGLTLNGGSLSYEGTFVDTQGVSVEGTIEVTCS